MIVYNTTFHVDLDVHNEFLEYMLEKFIPAATKSGLLESPRLAKVFGKEEDDNGISYAMEFVVADIVKLEKWNSEESSDIYAQLLGKFKDKVIGFSTLMQTVEY